MPKILYIDMDNVLVDFKSAFRYIPPDVLQVHHGRLDEIHGIFSFIEPAPGPIEA